MNARDKNGDAPIHAIIRAKNKHKFECLMALLVHSDVSVLDIDATSADDNTALHLAVMVCLSQSFTHRDCDTYGVTQQDNYVEYPCTF